MSNQNPAIQNEEKELPFHMNYIPLFVQRKCELELKETPDRRTQSIQELRNFLKDDEATKDIWFHEDFLVQYLRHSKYNTHKAFTYLRKYYILRNNDANLFESLPDEIFLTLKSTKFASVLPKRCPDGCTVLLIQLGKWDPDELPFDYFKRIAVITFSQLFRDPMTQINGIKVIYDFDGTRMEQLKYGTPRNLYLFYYMAFVGIFLTFCCNNIKN
ncbi:unnamed protein product [Larinioides sclopetarius]|uniref:CRAL-TRIO domain-containing protein n=1 Tax=Larinioides sclopetarius TaxID=280406 RepID=A0AAV2BPF9_9ARAC